MKSLRTSLLVLAVVALVLTMPIPVHGRAIKALLDLGHLAVGGVLAWAAWRVLRPRVAWSDATTALACVALVTVFGIAAEGAQHFTGRHSSWLDAATNTAGALAFLCLAAARRGRWAFALLAAAVAIPPSAPRLVVLWDTYRQHRDAPMLGSFEDGLELGRWAFLESTGRRVRDDATHGDHSLEVVLGPGEYPGVSLVWPLPDWRGHQDLLFDVFVDEGPAFELIVKVEDHEHDPDRYVYEDRFHAYFELGPGLHQLRIPIADIRAGPKGRELDISDVKTVEWFVDGLDAARTIHLDNVRLR